MKTRIKELRESKHLTQNALAIAINCSQNYISQIELERTVPRADVLISIAKYFNTTVDYLLYLSEQRYKIETTLPSNQQKILTYTEKLYKLSAQERQTIYALLDVMIDLKEGK